jgi:hypothetical protein
MKEYEATEIAYKNGYEKGKADGAREIFEEIEKFQRSPIPESKPVYILRGEEIAELKKKYTEEIRRDSNIL